MIKNNYDHNSKGLSVEIAYDRDLYNNDYLDYLTQQNEDVYFAGRFSIDEIFQVKKGVNLRKELEPYYSWLVDEEHADEEDLQDYFVKLLEDEIQTYIDFATFEREISFFELKKEYALAFISGYSQSDYAVVVYKKEEYPNTEKVYQTFQNLLFNTRYYVIVCVEGVELDFYLTDEYDYSKEVVIEDVLRENPIEGLQEELEKLLPSDLY